VNIGVGQQVIWTNDDNQIRTGQIFDLGILGPGAMFSFKFDHPAEIQYYCTLHHQMIGNIKVLPPGDADESSVDVLQGSSNMTEPISENNSIDKTRTLNDNEI
jgi:hypothetical protein